MNERRSWFQLHLSTCVVMMFVAGILTYINLLAKPYPVCHPSVDFPCGSPYFHLYYHWGWPKVMVSAEHRWSLENRPELLYEETLRLGNATAAHLSLFRENDPSIESPYFIWPGLFWNLATAMAILLVLAVGMEWALRRRERARGDCGSIIPYG